MESAALPPRVFAVVVTYNGEGWVAPCFGSLRESTYPISVIAVDNASTDATVQHIRASFPDVQLVENKANAGFGRANNQGIEQALSAGADFIFLVNQDVRISADTVGNLISALSANPEFGVISPVHYNGKGTALDRNFEVYASRDGSSAAERTAAPPTQVHRAAFINAAAWMVSRNCLRTVGGFGYPYFHYGEDHEFVQRMEHSRLLLGWIGSTVIYHDREDRAADALWNTYPKLVRYYYVGILVALADLRHSFAGAALRSALWSLRHLTGYFFKGRLAAPFVFITVIFKAAGRCAELLRYRREINGSNEYKFLKVG